MTKPAANCYQHVMLMAVNGRIREPPDKVCITNHYHTKLKNKHALAIMAHKLFLKKNRRHR